MDLHRLYEILTATTMQLRKAGEVESEKAGGIDITRVYAAPSVVDAGTGLVLIDMEFVVIGVDKTEAERHRDDLIAILDAYPNPERLAGGPSYIEVGGVIGSQGAAFQLFALGKVLGLWDVLTPGAFGSTGAEARELAGRGFIMISGYPRGHKAV